MTHEDTVLRMALTAWLTDPRYGPTEPERAMVVARLTVTTEEDVEGVPRGTVGTEKATIDWRTSRRYVESSMTDRLTLRRMALGWAAVAMPRVAEELRRQWEMEITQAELFA